MKTRFLFLLALALTLGSGPELRAQSGVGDIVYTVGTVARDTHGRDWAYLLWQATQPALLSNRVFAVYSKPGDPTNNAAYTRLSLVTVQTDPRVIEPLLERAANLGDDLIKLQQDLLQLFGGFVPGSAISRADQLSAVIRGSVGDPRNYANLVLLARNHAAINLALGFADAQLIAPGKTTFEIRAFDPALNQDLAVIGRATVEAGNPTLLPPPGPPVLVPEPTPRGDLNLKFRWGTPDNLRRLSLMQFGYDLYRVTTAYAGAHGWNEATPPPLAALGGLVLTNPAVARRVNRVPITPSKLMTLPEAGTLVPPGDTNTFFIMDDDGRGRTNYVNYGFTNGATFFYYVAARDVLGRDGVLSPGLLATVCDRLAPYPPMHVHVLNDYQYNPVTLSSNQALRVVWQQNQQTNDSVINYYVYRWTNLVQMNALSGNPGNNLIGIVAHVPGQTNNSYLDNGAGSPSALGAYGETFWYTVKAADAGACGPNLSGAGGPAFGVLRDRIGPPAGTGFIQINCVRPVVTVAGVGYPPTRNPDPTNFDVFINCTRTDSRVEWAEFYGIATYSAGVSGPPLTATVSNYFGRLYYQGASAVSAWWYPTRNPFTNGQVTSIKMDVYCRAGLLNGKISNLAAASVTPPSIDVTADVEFTANAQVSRVIAGNENTRDCREHDPGGGGGLDPTNNNIGILIVPTAGSAEYRLYRRVDAGPLSLLCQGPITNIAQIIQCFETAMPANGGSICFYLQLLDVNGNPSPLTPLGCVDTAPNTPLPRPVLAKITSTGDLGSPGMKVSWFCPPYGVERFEVRVAGLPTPPNTNQYALSQLLSSTGALPVSMPFTNSGTNLTLAFNTFRTPKTGPGFGNNGAVFQVPCKIELGKTYFVTVRALSKNGNPGDFSNFESFVWAPTNAPSPQVPWPARPLPPTAPNFFALAFFLSPNNTNNIALQTASFEGNGVLVGLKGFSPRTIFSLKENPPRIGAGFDPMSAIQTNGFGSFLFPCVAYRYQVPNAAFPTVSGDTIQVSPLMENIAYQLAVIPGQTTNTYLHDPFIAVTASADNTSRYGWLWLKDTQPVISGARYQYVLAHFGPNHEIDQLIPSNEVEVP